MAYRLSVVAALAASVAVAATNVDAMGVDVDITFIVDQSGSMDDEFLFLAGAIGGFLTDLEADSRISSAQAALVTYEDDAVLVTNMTSDSAALSAAFGGVGTFGGTENAYEAVDAALPGGNQDLGISYRAGSVRSLILITDEDADDAFSYANSFGTGETALGSYLDATGFLLNIIYDLGTSADADFDGIARPSTGLFDIDEFRTDRTTFFDAFTATKIEEIVVVPTGQVPLPAGLPLLGGALALGGFVASRRNKKS